MTGYARDTSEVEHGGGTAALLRTRLLPLGALLCWLDDMTLDVYAMDTNCSKKTNYVRSKYPWVTRV